MSLLIRSKTQLKSAYSKLASQEFNEKDLEIIALLIFLGIYVKKNPSFFIPFFSVTCH